MEESPAVIRISVVIVSRNAAPDLRRCLAALEKSISREAIEILVVDNGSSDGSAGIDLEYPTVTVLRLPRNFGLTKARNIGARTATGEFLLYLNPAVEPDPSMVQTLADKLAGSPEIAAAVPLLMDTQGRPAIRVLPLPKAADVLKLWKAGGEPPRGETPAPDGETSAENTEDVAVMLRRQFLKGMNYFDERYGQTWSGTELFLQIRHAGRKTVVMPEARGVRHIGQLATADPRLRATLSSDFASGAARYMGKHFGAGAAIRFRLAAVLDTVGKLLIFRDLRFHASLLAGLLSAQKIDGSQSRG